MVLQQEDIPTRKLVMDQSQVHVYRAVAAYYRATKDIEQFPSIGIEKIKSLDELHDGSLIAVRMASGNFSIFEKILIEEMRERDGKSMKITNGTYSFVSTEPNNKSKISSMQPIPSNGIRLGRDQLSRGIYQVMTPITSPARY